ncbi:hypothetical protein [Gimesia sp.]|uniref:hypothetical protein n=1 Tax=Gimesia sp. TaxID=2024833 RepID=UPI003A918CE7
MTIKDPKDCQKFSIALQPRYILRKVASDVGRSHGGYGGGASLGVMKVRYQGVKKPLIIGIAQIGFFLDVWHGNDRQEFFSKALSVAVDHAVKKYSDYQIPKEHLGRQSGRVEGPVDEQREGQYSLLKRPVVEIKGSGVE